MRNGQCMLQWMGNGASDGYGLGLAWGVGKATTSYLPRYDHGLASIIFPYLGLGFLLSFARIDREEKIRIHGSVLEKPDNERTNKARQIS